MNPGPMELETHRIVPSTETGIGYDVCGIITNVITGTIWYHIWNFIQVSSFGEGGGGLLQSTGSGHVSKIAPQEKSKQDEFS